MSNDGIIILLVFFFIKHFVVDFLLQNKYQYSNKHILGHPGGLLHALLHGVATFMVLHTIPGITTGVIISLSLFEASIHYFIDLTKMNINIKYELTPQDNELYWVLMGWDQLLHYLTYAYVTHAALISLSN